jgi:hypothetical protein
MKNIIIIFMFLPCCVSLNKYKIKDCENLDMTYQYEILGIETLKNNTYKAHVYINFPDTILVSYNLIACSAIEICIKESIIEGYFYSSKNCLRADSINSETALKYNSQSYFDCYLGSLKIKWTENWKEKIKPSDFEFLTPIVKIKF